MNEIKIVYVAGTSARRCYLHRVVLLAEHPDLYAVHPDTIEVLFGQSGRYFEVLKNNEMTGVFETKAEALMFLLLRISDHISEYRSRLGDAKKEEETLLDLLNQEQPGSPTTPVSPEDV